MHLLVIRFSAMGDVAMTVPVVYSLAVSHPEIQITMLTRKHLTPLFQWMPDNVKCLGVNLKDYDGISGLGRLYKELKTMDFDAVADIHDVLRTQYLRLRFRLSGKKVVVIDKGRAEKKAILGNGMTSPFLKPTIERYRDVFMRLGIDFPLVSSMPQFSNSPKDTKQIGIAPFAAHEGKIYPLDKMHQVADMLADRDYQVFLFGAGKEEQATLESWERENIRSVAGRLGGLGHELELMGTLDLMISMDSSNMHMAAMMGTPTLSIWGATHPKAGFMAWGQKEDSTIQLPLDCRPCSIYGNKKCKYGDYRCMTGITPEQIVEKVVNG